MSRALTERRAADRKEMAARLTAAIEKHGVTVERFEHDRQIAISFRTERGLGFSVDFDGDNHPALTDRYCVPWHIRLPLDTPYAHPALSARFGQLMGADVNPHHFQKCTAFFGGIDALICAVELALEMDADGSAYDPARTRQKITEYQQRGWPAKAELPPWLLALEQERAAA